MDDLDFLDGTLPNDDAQPVEMQASETPPVDPQASPPADPETPPIAAEAAPSPPSPEPGHVPIGALMDERDKRKALEARLASLEQTQQRPMPDPNLDPGAYQQHQMGIMQQALLDTRLNMSEVAAKRHYGAELTDTAKQWALDKFGSNPAFQSEVLNNPDPYDYAVQAYQRDQIASQVTADDFTAFQAWKAAQAQIASGAAPVTPPSAPIPRSIASTPSAGGVAHVPLDDLSVFGSAIP